MEAEGYIENAGIVGFGEFGPFEISLFRLKNDIFVGVHSTLIKSTIKCMKNGKNGVVDSEAINILSFAENVELINTISRRLNGFNYFEIYTPGSAKIIDVVVNKVNSKYLIPHEVISRRNSHLRIPSGELKSYIFEDYPIWYIGISKKYKTYELILHFEVFKSILSKQILNLIPQPESKAKISTEKLHLTPQLENKVEELEKCISSLRSENESLVSMITGLASRIDELEGSHDELQNEFELMKSRFTNDIASSPASEISGKSDNVDNKKYKNLVFYYSKVQSDVNYSKTGGIDREETDIWINFTHTVDGYQKSRRHIQKDSIRLYCRKVAIDPKPFTYMYNGMNTIIKRTLATYNYALIERKNLAEFIKIIDRNLTERGAPRDGEIKEDEFIEALMTGDL